MMLAGEKLQVIQSAIRKRRLDIDSKWETEYWLNNGVNLDELLEQTYEDGSTTSKLRYIDIRMGTKCLQVRLRDVSSMISWLGKRLEAVVSQITNELLKQTMVWENKGKEFGASYNWHKDNPIPGTVL